MDTTTGLKPKPMPELLPELRALRIQSPRRLPAATTSSKKKNGNSSVEVDKTVSHTAKGKMKNNPVRKVLNCLPPKPKPVSNIRSTMAPDSPKFTRPEFRPKKPLIALQALRIQPPRRLPAATTSSKKKNGNSSVEVDKTVSHTAKGKMKNNPVRKVLNCLPPKPKPVSNIRSTMAPDSPKFTRPEFRPKKPLIALQAHNNVRISGINNIAETPVVSKPFKMTLANKENVSNLANKAGIKKFLPPPQPLIKKTLIPVIPDTPMSNESWKSSCFLQKEKEIYDAEEKLKAIAEEPTLENIAAVTPPASTLFKEYRNVQEFFNHSSEMDNSALYNDNTIMSFEKHADTQENNKREESVIVSCELLNKATVANGKMSTELEDLLQLESNTEQHLKIIDINISAMNKMKQSQLTSLQYVRKLIKEKKPCETGDKTLTHNKETPKMSTELEDLLQLESNTEQHLKIIDINISAMNKMKQSQLTSLQYVRKLIKEKKPCETGDKTLTHNKETPKMSTELEDLLQLESNTEQHLKMIDISISALNKMKQSQLTSLQYVRKLIKEKKPCETGDKTLTHNKETPKIIKTENFSPERKTLVSMSKPCSVIKSCSKSPSYNIPKKNLCLRKKVICKSMPNIANEQITPVKADMGNKALSMYLKMKEHMNFLTTPVAKRESHVPDTPAVISHNLQKQLDKLYDEN